ncbi:chondroitin proteoglycan 2-like [Haliotis cracherodii]|uniref:chondroitin proteoglycan 2-like n=1 Tax=Haliotis cracherodii TaxID=6455 RepID=UPI0039ED8295
MLVGLLVSQSVLAVPENMWRIVAVLFLAFTASAELRWKRQVPCTNNWVPPQNPCVGNNKRVYFPHPTDNTKFLQCDNIGQMYIIQCPSGLTYNSATTSCRSPVVPQVTPAATTITSGSCTKANYAAGLIYFAIPNINTKFIECGPNGGATILSCPSMLIWNQARRACEYATTAGVVVTPPPTVGPVTVTGPGTGTGTGTNPCLSKQAAAGKLYFPHPDIHKFIQCDNNGDAFVGSCPGGLIWNTVLETCHSPFASIG